MKPINTLSKDLFCTINEGSTYYLDEDTIFSKNIVCSLPFNFN